MKVIALIVYVDHMVLIRDDPDEMKSLQEYLATEFGMKNLEQLKYFLRIEIAISGRGIFLSQRKYVLDLLTEIRMFSCKPTAMLIKLNHKLEIFPNQFQQTWPLPKVG